jgi:hypothetical protein
MDQEIEVVVFSSETAEDDLATEGLPEKTEEQKLDALAMKAAKQGEIRLKHSEKQEVPGSTIFTK